MEPLDLDSDPYANDDGHLGVALSTLAELLIPCLDVAGARSVVEIGAYAGDLTGLLLRWAERSEAKVIAIDPSPQAELVRLAAERPTLELIRKPSLTALRHIALPDVVIVDGDHNYYTVSEELRLISERARDGELPLLLLHDVCWPHGRRDDYYDPELVPEDQRQPIAPNGQLDPDHPGTHPEGMPYPWPAAREGGPRNGVLTAVEDFLETRDGLRLAVVPAFYGLGVLWRLDAPWAGALGELLELWDRNPLLERLEYNRVRHVARSRCLDEERIWLGRRAEDADQVLRRLLGSHTYALAKVLSRLRGRGAATLSDEELLRALD